MSSPVLEFKNLSFKYNDILAIDNCSAVINPGDYVGLIGPNGSGKTTLVKVLLGLLKPIKGEISIFGKPIGEFDEWHRIGYVPQKPQFDPDFPISVREVVAMGRFGHRGPILPLNAADHHCIDDVMVKVGVDKYADKRIGDLSGGQQQKVFIARALVSNPDLLILDEPTTGVDAGSQNSFYHFLHGLNEKGLSLILISHDTGAINKHVNKLFCMNRRLFTKGCSIEFMFKDKIVDKDHVRRVKHKHA